jgi:hypothetical protein
LNFLYTCHNLITIYDYQQKKRRRKIYFYIFYIVEPPFFYFIVVMQQVLHLTGLLLFLIEYFYLPSACTSFVNDNRFSLRVQLHVDRYQS